MSGGAELGPGSIGLEPGRALGVKVGADPRGGGPRCVLKWTRKAMVEVVGLRALASNHQASVWLGKHLHRTGSREL